MKLAKSHEGFLRSLGVGREVSNPKQSVVGTLRRRGLLHTRPLLGKPGIWAQPTPAGHDLLRAIAAERGLQDLRRTPPATRPVPAPATDPLVVVRRLMQSTGFDEEEHDGNRLLFSSREEGNILEGRADPGLVSFARNQATAIETSVPGARARVDVVDEWVSIEVTLPGVPAAAIQPLPSAAPRSTGVLRRAAVLSPGDEVRYTNFTAGGSHEGTAIVTWDHGGSVEARTLGGQKLRLERAPDGSLRRFT